LQTKEDLRGFYLNYRSNIDNEQRESAGMAIKEAFLNLDEVKKATHFLLYFSLRNEVNTRVLIEELLAEGKKVYLPYCIVKDKELRISPVNNLDDDLITGAYGIKEPRLRLNSSIKDLDIVVVPGIAFTRNGHRIGYGGGYYDRFLVKLPDKCRTIGLTYHSLLVQTLPFDPHDQQINIVVTEKEIVYTGGEGD